MPTRPAPMLFLAAALATSGACAQTPPPRGVVRSEAAAFRVEVFARRLEHPWGAAFLPDDGRMLVTERPGRLRLVERDGGVSAPLSGMPAVEARGQGGLLDIALAPDFARTRELFLCHAALVEGGALTRLVRARLSTDATALVDVRTVLDATPAQAQGRNHYGCRIVFSPDGRHLFLSTGDRFIEKQRAQRLDDLAGKVLRLTRDGGVPADNPFVGRSDARPEIWSYGHRNVQGLAFQPGTAVLWEAEYGPRGGDEVNVIRRGANYGWPLVTHGVNYDGSTISDRRSAPGMVDPLRVWTPVISPSGIAFYGGDAFPAWRGNLFLAALNRSALVRLTVEGERVTGEERLLQGLARFRQVVVGPDGFLYVLTDGSDGRILRLVPG